MTKEDKQDIISINENYTLLFDYKSQPGKAIDSSWHDSYIVSVIKDEIPKQIRIESGIREANYC